MRTLTIAAAAAIPHVPNLMQKILGVDVDPGR